MIAGRVRGQGRPLRFLLLVLGGWTLARAALLWPEAAPERLAAVRGHMPPARAPVIPLAAAANLAASDLPLIQRADALATGLPLPRARTREGINAPAPAPATALAPTTVSAPSIATAVQQGTGDRPAETSPAGYGVPQPVATTLQTRRRWSGSAWALVRGTGNAGGVGTPQLGGSQIGARLAYRLDEAGRVAAVARAAAALGVKQQEAAIGVEWQPTRLPLRLIAEQRIGIANIRGGPSLGIVGGVNAVPLGAGLRVDGYAQGGVIARNRADGYVDGAITLGRTLASSGGVRVDLALGAWGAAQRGARRVDVGPSLGIVLPVAGRGIRVAAEWRERVAGNARPGSGAVLSLGADF